VRITTLVLLATLLLSGCAAHKGGLRKSDSSLETSPCAGFSSGTHGDYALSPLRVFDDGIWTYFQMFEENNMDKQTRFPALYRVVGQTETPVNTRVVGGTVIAETTAEIWVLRNGDQYLCIRKE
jgi:hypothetical protein